MGNKDLKEEVLEAFLIALDEKLDKRNTLSKDQIDNEKGEFKRAGLSRAEAKKGRGITLKNLKGVGNTDAEDFDADTPHGKMRQWARTMQTNKTDKKKGKESKKAGRVIPSKEDRKKSRDQRRAVHTQVQSDTDAPSIISTQGKGKDKKRDVLAGNTRISLRRALGKPLKAHIFKSSKPAPRAYEQKRGITGEETIHIRNAFLNYLSERRNEDPKGMAFKAGAGKDSEWGPPTKYGDEATRKSVAASAWATRKKLREPGRKTAKLSPEERKALRFKVHQGWSKAASTSPHQTPEQKARRSKLIRKTRAGYEGHTEEEKAKDDQFADIGRQAVEKHEKNRRRPTN